MVHSTAFIPVRRGRMLVPLVLAALSVFPAHATTIPVSTDSDTEADDGQCSLREAVTAANTDTASGSSPGECPAGSGADMIAVPAMTILLGPHLEVNSALEVVGSGIGSTVIDGQRSDPTNEGVFFVSGGELSLRNMTITGGNSQAGGGVRVNAGTVEIRDARITNNYTVSAGGGVYVAKGAQLTVRRVTIDANYTSGFGGGIANDGTTRVDDSLIGGNPTVLITDPLRGNAGNRVGGIHNGPTGVLNVTNTTLSGNLIIPSSTGGTAGIRNLGFAVLNNVTVTGNTVGRRLERYPALSGGLTSPAGATTVLLNSIVAGNTGGAGPHDCDGELSSDSAYSLIGDTKGCTLPPLEQPPTPASFILDKAPRLGPLADNGGPTRSHLPDEGSPVIATGNPTTPGGPAAGACAVADQRGMPRQLLCDMGAIEREVQIPTEFALSTTNDGADARPGDGVCATEIGGDICTLRAAIQEANRIPGNQSILMPYGVYTLTIPAAEEDGGAPDATGDLDLLDDITFRGVGPTYTIIDGNHQNRILDVAPNARVTLRDIGLRNGNDGGGAGVRVSSASLTTNNVIIEENASSFEGGGIEVRGVNNVLDISNSIIRNNTAQSSSGNGGGISIEGGKATLTRSTLSGNEAGGAGGGLFGSSAQLNVIQSTVSSNKAAGGLSDGGGISGTGLNIVESTISGNSASSQGGGVSGDGAIVNSTISGNTSATNGGGVSTSGKLSLLNVTVAGNVAMSGGNGLQRFGSTSGLTVQNTILANPGGTECATVLPTSKGNNIASDRSCALAGGGDKQATDALLGPLANNGGPTQTRLLRTGSPALDAAASAGLATDQRGVRRPQGPRPDIGAVEGTR